MAVIERDRPTTGPVVDWPGLKFGSSSTGGEHGVQLTVVVHAEPIYREVARRLQELVHLRRGWDGHDGLPPRAEAIREALTFLDDMQTVYRGLVPPPAVGPTPDGGVVLVWRRASSEAEILFLVPGAAEFALSDRGGVHPTESHDNLGRHELLAIAQSLLIA